MNGEAWTINSDHTLAAFISNVKDQYGEHKYLTYAAPRIGADRSIDQNALFHVWCTQYAAYKTNITTKDVSPGLLDGMKRIVKKQYTAAHPDSYPYMIYELINPFDGSSKKDYTSSKSWKRGEMFQILSWLQMVAAEDGLILESKGVFAKNQRDHAGQ